MIGKTRQASTAQIAETYDPEVGPARGMLRRIPTAGEIAHSRRSPSPDLAFWIAHYWTIHWDFRDCAPHLAENLPHPNVHLVFEKGRPAVVNGVQTRRFSRVLDDRSSVFGVKFRPGGFRAFSGSAISRFANRTIPASCVFGSDIQALETVVADSLDDGTKIEAANAFFRARAPERDPRIAQASQLVERILQEPGIRTVDDLASRAGVAKRNLQRLFQEYVGVSPKWVIRRYRLHELVETLNSGSMPDWPQLALDLGYFDQAHLINDFKSIIGVSPMQYLKIT